MNKFKIIVAAVAVIAIAAGAVALSIYGKNWPARYSDQMDHFFGEGNWECIDEETKESLIYTDYIIVRSNPALSGEVPGKFKNWYISFENRSGKDEVWYITNHTYKINHDEYGIFSSKRYSGKQALTLELMDISFGMVGEEIMEDVIRSELSRKEADCIEVTMSYDGGNPKPKFYNDLAEQEWFQVNKVTAGDYLEYDAHDFYIHIRAHDYRLEKLSAKEQWNVLNSLEPITKKLCKKYGDDASFWIYFDDNHTVDYRDGREVED